MWAVMKLLMVAVLCCLHLGWVSTSWAWGEKPLAVIDGQEFFADDYKQWWVYWRDSEEQKPEGVQPFINWMLMVHEAERMDLASLPEYQRKAEVFLEARTLMLLKHDEIDSKIKLTDADLKAVYERDYVPRRLVGLLEFSSADEAKKFLDQSAGQSMDIERLQLMASEEAKPLFVFQQPQWLRALSTPALWRPILDQATPGSLHGPLPFGEKAAILFVAEVKAGDPEDYANKKETIRYDLRKQREQELTDKLVRKLMTKYHVHIDQNVLEKINLSDLDANDQELVVITSDRSRVTVGYFLDLIRKEIDITHKLPSDVDGQMVMKQRLANAMVANSMVSWEALSRHYEEKEPLLGSYKFYRQNRLVVELEGRTPGDIQVAEGEIQDYYQTHLEDFKRPEMIRGVMVSGEEPVVRKVWAEAISGTELIKAAQNNGATVVVSSANEVPWQHFSQVAQKILSGMKAGDLSQPFLDSGHSVVVKLIGRKAGAAIPLEQVAPSIKEKIVAEKKAKRKQALIDALRSRSTVNVNDEVWAKLEKELLSAVTAPAPAN